MFQSYDDRTEKTKKTEKIQKYNRINFASFSYYNFCIWKSASVHTESNCIDGLYVLLEIDFSPLFSEMFSLQLK